MALQYDEAYSQRLLATYLTPDVVAQREETLRALALRPGERVLDVGTGPGLLAASMADAVGTAGRICAVDVSESVLEIARRQIGSRPTIELRAADATSLPYEDGDFDVGVSTQVYEYVGEVETALRELFRVLRPSGRALIVDTDWDSIVWASSNEDRMRRVLAAWEEHAAHPRLPRRLVPMLQSVGFLVDRVFVIPLLSVGSHANTYSAGLIEFVAAFARDRRGLTEDDLRSWSGDLRELGSRGAYFFALNRFVFLATKPTDSGGSL
jgi:arsenite methyltransferase